jgi:hypothetical protein
MEMPVRGQIFVADRFLLWIGTLVEIRAFYSEISETSDIFRYRNIGIDSVQKYLKMQKLNFDIILQKI